MSLPLLTIVLVAGVTVLRTIARLTADRLVVRSAR
jgi:hypothetical protein